MNIEIVPFKMEYATAFRDLNVEWLDKFFIVEPHDKEVLSNCKENIIDQGGFIYFAKLDTEIVGCFAFSKVRNDIYELTKMAVSTEYRGKKIGQQLLQFSIDTAKEKDFKEVLLYSNRKLENAIHLYRKLGFKEVPLEANAPYKRADIKMVLEIV